MEGWIWLEIFVELWPSAICLHSFPIVVSADVIVCSPYTRHHDQRFFASISRPHDHHTTIGVVYRSKDDLLSHQRHLMERV